MRLHSPSPSNQSVRPSAVHPAESPSGGGTDTAPGFVPAALPGEAPAPPSLSELPLWAQRQIIETRERREVNIAESERRQHLSMRSGILSGSIGAAALALTMTPHSWPFLLLCGGVGGISGAFIVRDDCSPMMGSVVYGIPLIMTSVFSALLGTVILDSRASPTFIFTWLLFVVMGGLLGFVAEHHRNETMPF